MSSISEPLLPEIREAAEQVWNYIRSSISEKLFWRRADLKFLPIAHLVWKLKEGKALSPPLLIHNAYCSGLSPVAQFGEGPAFAVPAVLKRITPEASEQNDRWPVVPTVMGTAVSM